MGINNALQEYIRIQLKRGVYQKSIKLKLLSSGWNEKDISDTFILLSKTDPSLPIKIDDLKDKDEEELKIETSFMRYHKRIFTLLAIIFCIGLILFIISFFLPKLPNEQGVKESIINSDPIQTDISGRISSFYWEYQGFEYFIQPIYNYDIQAIIVSSFEYNSLSNIIHKNDPGNVRDLCLVWGKNVVNNEYKKVEYRSSTYHCSFRINPGANFSMTQASNNHLLPANETIAKRILSAKVGDQIHLKGYLIYYENKDFGSRGTSTSREDEVCETIFVKEFSILKKNYNLRYFIEIISKIFMLLSVSIFLIKLVLLPILKNSNIKNKKL